MVARPSSDWKVPGSIPGPSTNMSTCPLATHLTHFIPDAEGQRPPDEQVVTPTSV